MTHSLLEESRGHLADLLEACQRCAWYLQSSATLPLKVGTSGSLVRSLGNGHASRVSLPADDH